VQPSATNQSTQQHEASRGLSAIAEVLVLLGKAFKYLRDLSICVMTMSVAIKYFLGLVTVFMLHLCRKL